MCKTLAQGLTDQRDCIYSRATIAHLAIRLVVVRAIFLNATTLLKMKMMPATS